jgi:hypothetical protein
VLDGVDVKLKEERGDGARLELREVSEDKVAREICRTAAKSCKTRLASVLPVKLEL